MLPHRLINIPARQLQTVASIAYTEHECTSMS